MPKCKTCLPCAGNCTCILPGKRCSGKRSAVKEALLSAGRHLNAEQLHRLASTRSPGIGIATVYRSLKCLCGCGKAVEIRLGDGTAVYASISLRGSRAHLVCSACGCVAEAAAPELEKLTAVLAVKHGFLPSVLELRGLCEKCGKTRKQRSI